MDRYGGVPAGCNTDHDNSILVADMRLGILRVLLDSSFRQVSYTADQRLIPGLDPKG